MKTLPLLCLMAWAAPLVADEFEIPFGQPVDAAVWQINEDPQHDIYDAVVIKHIVDFRQSGIHQYRMVRIFNESGKAAAEFFDATGLAQDLRGRVIDRSGEETRFNSRNDLVEVLKSKDRYSTDKSRLFLPSGLTGDCVVEYAWVIPAEKGMPKRGLREAEFFVAYRVQESYYIMEKQYRVRGEVTRGNEKFIETVFTARPVAAPAEYERTKDKGVDLYTYRKVPAVQPNPYGSPHWDAYSGYLYSFKLVHYGNAYLGNTPETFWKRMAYRGLREAYKDTPRPLGFRGWVKDLKTRLPKDPIQAFLISGQAFKDRVANENMMSPEDRAKARDQRKAAKVYQSELAKTWETGFGPASHMAYLYAKVLEDLKIPYHLMFARSYRDPIFFPDELNPYTLGEPLFAVKRGENDYVFVSFHYPQYQVGELPASYENCLVLSLDTDDKWKHSISVLPSRPVTDHQRIRQYGMAVSTNGQAAFKSIQKTTGVFNAIERGNLYEIPADERSEKVRRQLSRRNNSWLYKNVQVTGADKTHGPIQIDVEGSGSVVDNGDWVAIEPFPGSNNPLAIPRIWPSKRSQPIMLGYRRAQIDVNSITVPAGWNLRGDNTWKQTNELGYVSFTATQKANVITVRRDIVITEPGPIPPQKEALLKHFIGWMEEAEQQHIAVAKGGKS